MSTYWHFECLDHDPPLKSTDEFTQHTEDPYFWAGVRLAHQRPLPRDRDSRYWQTYDIADYFTDHANAFLVQHPSCRLCLINEYGERRDLPTPEEIP